MRAYQDVLRKTKLQRFSDLYLKCVVGAFLGEWLIFPFHDADALVLASDMSNGT